MLPHKRRQPPEVALPPGEVRILTLNGELGPDGRRVRVELQLTPFVELPNVEVTITNADQQEVSSIYIIETIDERMTFTMHLRGENLTGSYTLRANLTYPDLGTVDERSVAF